MVPCHMYTYIYMLYIHIYIYNTYTWTKRLKSQIQDIMLFITGSGQSRAKPCWLNFPLHWRTIFQTRWQEVQCQRLMALKSLGNWGEANHEVQKPMELCVFSQDFRQNMTKDMAISKAWHAVLGDFTAFQTSSLGLPVFGSKFVRDTESLWTGLLLPGRAINSNHSQIATVAPSYKYPKVKWM